VNNEIIIGEDYTSILKTNTKICDSDINDDYNEKNIVEHKPIIRNRIIRTSDFFDNLRNGFTNQNEILPTGCKHFQSFNDGYKILVVEEPPRIRTIKVDLGMESTIEKLKITGKIKEYGYENFLKENKKYPYSFQLSFPYVVFIILLNRHNELVVVKPFFRLHPITSLADYLFMAPLYNIPRNQHICLGGVESFNNIFKSVENIIETFWLNRYNNDYANNIKLYNNSDAYEVHDYLSWMYFTKINPMFIYNVKWILYNNNLGEVINNTKIKYKNSYNSYNSYKKNKNSAFKSNSINLNPESNAKNACYFVIINNEHISVGDEIIFEDKSYYLYSIITKDDGYTYDSVELECVDGTLIKVPYDVFETDIKTKYKPNFIEEVNVNGNTIRPNDIINCRIGDYDVYKKIKSIRKGLDGKIEVMVGNDHYLIENIDFKVIDTSNIKIDGKIIDVNKIYHLVQMCNNHGPIFKIYAVTFDEILINSSGNFIIKFKDNNDNTINLNINDYESGSSNYSFIDENELLESDVICQFDKILVNFDIIEENKFKFVKNNGLIVSRKHLLKDFNPSGTNHEIIIEKILIKDGTRLYIPGSLIDIDFRIGDPIVYANWLKPEDMLKISSIDKFEFDEEKKILYVCSTTLNKEEQFKIPYIDLRRYRVNIGVIRKVESKCGEWKSGDKIKANSTGITKFPKKDVNTIIAFINDGATKYPVALCSNLCTLWMNEETINKFDLISLKSDKWPKFDNAPINIEKIKWQHGDNFISSSKSSRNKPINFLAIRSSTQYSFKYHYAMNYGVLEWGTNISKDYINKYYLRHGIIMPRIPLTNTQVAVNKKGFPNMLGGYITNTNSRIFIRSEQFKEDF